MNSQNLVPGKIPPLASLKYHISITKTSGSLLLVSNFFFDIYLRIDKSYTIYLKLLSNFPNSQITAT